MPDLPTKTGSSVTPALLQPINRKALLAKIRYCGAYNLNHAQMPAYLGISGVECKALFHMDEEVQQAYTLAQVDKSIHNLDIITNVADDASPENHQRLQAARYLYELHSGNRKQNNTYIAIQNNTPAVIKQENNMKLIDALDAEVLEQISND